MAVAKSPLVAAQAVDSVARMDVPSSASRSRPPPGDRRLAVMDFRLAGETSSAVTAVQPRVEASSLGFVDCVQVWRPLLHDHVTSPALADAAAG